MDARLSRSICIVALVVQTPLCYSPLYYYLRQKISNYSAPNKSYPLLSLVLFRLSPWIGIYVGQKSLGLGDNGFFDRKWCSYQKSYWFKWWLPRQCCCVHPREKKYITARRDPLTKTNCDYYRTVVTKLYFKSHVSCKKFFWQDISGDTNQWNLKQ